MSSLSDTGHRDNQKQRLYRSEHVIKYGSNITKHGQRFLVDEARLLVQRGYWAGPITKENPRTGKKVGYAPSIEDCQRYVDHLVREPWFQRRFGQRTYKVVWKAHGSATCSGGGIIALPPWSRTEGVILHEVAHGLPHEGAWHGPEFASLLLFLVRHRLGKEKADALRASYREQKVRLRPSAVPKPTRQVVTTAERREIEKEREHRLGTSPTRTHEAGRVLKALATSGYVKGHEPFGAAGTKQRRYALEVARNLSSTRIGGGTVRPWTTWIDEKTVRTAAATLRAAIAVGRFGEAGSIHRSRALAVARTLDKVADGKKVTGLAGNRVYAATPAKW